MGSSLSSRIRSIRLRGSACALPLTQDVHRCFEWDVCQLMFHFLKLGMLTWCGDWLRSCLDKNSVIVKWDPQQLVARLRHHAWTNHMYFANFAILQFAKMSSVNLQLVRMTFRESAASVFAQVTDTQHRLCLLYHMEVVSSQVAFDS